MQRWRHAHTHTHAESTHSPLINDMMFSRRVAISSSLTFSATAWSGMHFQAAAPYQLTRTQAGAPLTRDANSPQIYELLDEEDEDESEEEELPAGFAAKAPEPLALPAWLGTDTSAAAVDVGRAGTLRPRRRSTGASKPACRSRTLSGNTVPLSGAERRCTCSSSTSPSKSSSRGM